MSSDPHAHVFFGVICDNREELIEDYFEEAEKNKDARLVHSGFSSVEEEISVGITIDEFLLGTSKGPYAYMYELDQLPVPTKDQIDRIKELAKLLGFEEEQKPRWYVFAEYC